MNPETLEALKGSIEKWRKIAEEDGVDSGYLDCPLCKLFHPEFAADDERDECAGCPVQSATGMGLCRGTPYKEFYGWSDGIGRAMNSEARAAARAELEFLRSLLPKEEASE